MSKEDKQELKKSGKMYHKAKNGLINFQFFIVHYIKVNKVTLIFSETGIDKNKSEYPKNHILIDDLDTGKVLISKKTFSWLKRL